MRAAAALAVLALLAPAAAAPEASGTIVPYELMVGGERATGLLAIPEGPPRALVVMCHGYGNTVEAWRGHLAAAAEHGAMAVAMDYSPFFDLDQGAAWTNAAALDLAERFGLDRVVLFSVSMGGAACGLGLAEAPARADGGDLYDSWFEVEGVTALAETWLEAKLVGHAAAAELEAECGGTPLEQPACYARRSVAYRAPEVAAQARSVAIFHALNDGLVPHDQGRQLSATLRAAGVPTDMFTFARGDPAEQGTTGTGALGLPNPLALAGHAWEGSSTHVVMRTALAKLWAHLDGAYAPSNAEIIVDEQLGALPA